MKMFDLCYVGAGPATVFSVLHLIKNGYRGKICIVEKGKSLKDRTDICCGFMGCGCYSDSKLSKSLNVGGIIPNQTQEELDTYGNLILNYINSFIPNEDDFLVWDKNEGFDTSPSDLNWELNECCHVGSDRGRKIYYEMEKYITSQPNVTIYWETEVFDINYYMFGFSIKTNNKNLDIMATKVIIATGQRDSLPLAMVYKFNLTKENRMLQLGIRVEDKINPQYEKIINANYDFKFNKIYRYSDGVEVKVRTFCCNSGNAHVCAEKPSEGYIAFNGHSYKTPDPTNNTVNYGIMCAVKNLHNLENKKEQIELMKKINKLDCWEKDNFSSSSINEEPTSRRLLLNGLDHLKGLYPNIIIDSIHDFVYQLNKIVDLSNAHYYYPEIKPSGTSPKVNYNNMETEKENLYMIGDCHNTNSIIKSAIEGFIFAKGILEGK